MIDWLQNWFSSQCNGEWEHENMIQIYSLDNPGWGLKIDLNGTILESINIPYSLKKISQKEWIGFSIEKSLFKGNCGVKNLQDLLAVFKTIYENKDRTSTNLKT